MRGQPGSPPGFHGGAGGAALDAFLERAARLSDEERLAVAEARAAVVEDYHAAALRAAAEALAGRGDEYVRARARLAMAHVPRAVGDEGDAALAPEEAARWNEVARLVQLALDDALLAAVVRDKLHPNHLRELHRSWRVVAGAQDPAG